MSTTVYGDSDDLIEFEGDLRGEVGYIGRGPDEFCLISFSDGTVAKAQYGFGNDGIWKFTLLNQGKMFDTLDICTDSDANPHSDVMRFKDGKLRAWVGEFLEQVR